MNSADQDQTDNDRMAQTRPLEGMRVIDLTDHRGDIGPWILGELGADVVKLNPLAAVQLAAQTQSEKTMPLICAVCISVPTHQINDRLS